MNGLESANLMDGEGTLAMPEHFCCIQAYNLRGAGAVLHSHSINAVMATLLDESSFEFSVTQLEMIKASNGFAAE